MKKVLMVLCVVMACAAANAQQTASAAPAPAAPAAKAQGDKAPWPVWLAFNSTKNIDVAGVRFTLPYGECESVTGFDIGFYRHITLVCLHGNIALQRIYSLAYGNMALFGAYGQIVLHR